MEKFAIRIESQTAMRTFDYTDRNGMTQTGYSKEMVLSDGLDTFVAEATDQLAQNLEREPIADGTVVNAQLAMSVRTWKSERGNEVRSNVIRIQKIRVV